MNALALAVEFADQTLKVNLMDGGAITVPLAWYPRLLNASPAERSNWRICGGCCGINWPDIDEDLSVEGMLRGARLPRANNSRRTDDHRR